MIKPKKTITAYKLFIKKKDGNLYPLYVNKTTPVKIGVWMPAEEGERAKDNKSGGRMVKSSLGDLAYRPGWHAGDYPIATHIGKKIEPWQTKPDYRPDNQVWAECLISADVDWQERADANGTVLKTGPNKGEISAKSKAITDQIPIGGHYRFKTNNSMSGNWIIGGEIKIVRELSDAEVKTINAKGGHKDLPRLHELQQVVIGEDHSMGRDLVVNGRNILFELDNLHHSMLLLPRDVKLQDKYPELKDAYDLYNELYREILIADKMSTL